MAEGGSGRNQIETDADEEIFLECKESKTHVTVQGFCKNLAIGDNTTINSVEYKPKRKKKSKKPKKPVTESKENLTTNQRQNISDNLGEDWRRVGRYLGFGDGELDQLQMDNPNQSSEANYQMLLRWQQDKDDAATRSALAQIFGKIKRGDLQDLLADGS